MLVRRIDSWVGTDRFVRAGEVCDMPADLAELHIRAGSAEPYTEPKDDPEPAELSAPESAPDAPEPPPASSGGRKRKG